VNPGTEETPNEVERDVYDVELGLAVFEKIPEGMYFIKETVDVDGTVTIGGKKYKPVEDLYLLDVKPKGYYTISKVEIGEDKSGNTTYTNTGVAPTETMSFGEGSSAYTVHVPLVLNASALSRKVILKKVDGTNTPLKDKYFTVKYADNQTVVKVDGVPLERLQSGVGGAFWIGKLPFGTYYMEEFESDTELALVTRYFKFKVDVNGVSKPEETNWTLTNKLNDSTTPLP